MWDYPPIYMGRGERCSVWRILCIDLGHGAPGCLPGVPLRSESDPFVTKWRKHKQPDESTAAADLVAGIAVAGDLPVDGLPDRLLLALLDEAKELLAAVGVLLAVVSMDEDRVVVVSEPVNDRVSVDTACDLSRRVLTQVAATVPSSHTELVELHCGRRSERPCTFALDSLPQR